MVLQLGRIRTTLLQSHCQTANSSNRSGIVFDRESEARGPKSLIIVVVVVVVVVLVIGIF